MHADADWVGMRHVHFMYGTGTSGLRIWYCTLSLIRAATGIGIDGALVKETGGFFFEDVWMVVDSWVLRFAVVGYEDEACRYLLWYVVV